MIPVFRPSMGKEEFDAVKEVLESGWIGLGPKTKEFEERFAGYIGVKYASAMNSCSAALHLAIDALGIHSGEVISPSLTFVSTNHAILYNGAMPVFADVLEDTLTIDPDDIKRKMTKKTKAIMAMHYGGHPCDMAAIRQIADKNGILVIEDAAHAMGGSYGSKKVGSIGDAACFSFHAVKNLATGEGGMVTTNDKNVHDRLLKSRWLGITRDTWQRSDNAKYSWYYEVEFLGYKYHMSDINAAIGIAQLKKIDAMNKKREGISMRYNEAFKGLDWLKTPTVKAGVRCAHHNYVVKVKERDRFIEYLKKNGISSSVHYIPNHHYDIYKKCRANVPVTERVWKQIVTLPLFPDLKDSEIDHIIDTVKGFERLL
jgi:perosamine synthetase